MLLGLSDSRHPCGQLKSPSLVFWQVFSSPVSAVGIRAERTHTHSHTCIHVCQKSYQERMSTGACKHMFCWPTAKHTASIQLGIVTIQNTLCFSLLSLSTYILSHFANTGKARKKKHFIFTNVKTQTTGRSEDVPGLSPSSSLLVTSAEYWRPPTWPSLLKFPTHTLSSHIDGAHTLPARTHTLQSLIHTQTHTHTKLRPLAVLARPAVQC